MLQIQGLNQYYGESQTLWNLQLNVEEGSCMCVMGRNGVGKTSLLKSIMGLIPIKSGTIRFNHQDLTKWSPDARAKLGIGYVPQGREIFSQLTVEENLRVGLNARRDGLKTIPNRVYELFPVLKEMRYRRGGDLSGGQQQQLAVGRALATDPKLLIFDEPTEGIQPNIVQEIGTIIQRLNREEKITVLLVEQKLPFARKFAQHFCLMAKGQIQAKGKIEDLTDALVHQYLAV